MVVAKIKDQSWQSTNLSVSRERKVSVRNIEEISGKKMILKETLVMLVLDKKTIIWEMMRRWSTQEEVGGRGRGGSGAGWGWGARCQAGSSPVCPPPLQTDSSQLWSKTHFWPAWMTLIYFLSTFSVFLSVFLVQSTLLYLSSPPFQEQ